MHYQCKYMDKAPKDPDESYDQEESDEEKYDDDDDPVTTMVGVGGGGQFRERALP